MRKPHPAPLRQPLRAWNDPNPQGESIAADSRSFFLNGPPWIPIVGDPLYDDHFFNGDPLSIALWRIPAADWPKITLKVLPVSDALLDRLPTTSKRMVSAAQADGSLDKITVRTSERLELTLTL